VLAFSPCLRFENSNHSHVATSGEIAYSGSSSSSSSVTASAAAPLRSEIASTRLLLADDTDGDGNGAVEIRNTVAVPLFREGTREVVGVVQLINKAGWRLSHNARLSRLRLTTAKRHVLLSSLISLSGFLIMSQISILPVTVTLSPLPSPARTQIPRRSIDWIISCCARGRRTRPSASPTRSFSSVRSVTVRASPVRFSASTRRLPASCGGSETDYNSTSWSTVE
jgi:hypothetical protein